jgi:hypothetical protein
VAQWRYLVAQRSVGGTGTPTDTHRCRGRLHSSSSSSRSTIPHKGLPIEDVREARKKPDFLTVTLGLALVQEAAVVEVEAVVLVLVLVVTRERATEMSCGGKWLSKLPASKLRSMGGGNRSRMTK